MDNYLIIDTLSTDEVDDIRARFADCSWKSGADGGGHKYKLNAELVRDEKYDELDTKLVSGFARNADFNSFTMATSCTPTIFSKTGVGGQYPLHTDAPALGHYSLTTFLSDPDEYEGGELQLYMNGSINSFKLERGKSIIYNAGTPHAVDKVTKGERLVGVNWALSSYVDSDIRNIARNLKKIMNHYDEFGEDTSELSYAEKMEHPHFILQNIISGFERRFHSRNSIGQG